MSRSMKLASRVAHSFNSSLDGRFEKLETVIIMVHVVRSFLPTARRKFIKAWSSLDRLPNRLSTSCSLQTTYCVHTFGSRRHLHHRLQRHPHCRRISSTNDRQRTQWQGRSPNHEPTGYTSQSWERLIKERKISLVDVIIHSRHGFTIIESGTHGS